MWHGGVSTRAEAEVGVAKQLGVAHFSARRDQYLICVTVNRIRVCFAYNMLVPYLSGIRDISI